MSVSAVKVVFSALGILAIALAVRSQWMFVFFVISLGAVLLGCIAAFLAYLFKDIGNDNLKSSSPQTMNLPFCDDAVKEFIKIRGQHCRQHRDDDGVTPEGATRCLPVVFGRMVDAVLQQILDLALRDYVAHWLEGLCAEPHALTQTLKEDLWEAVRKLHERLSHVDQTQLVACDMTTKVTAHFERVRLAQAAALRVGGPAVIHVAPYIANAKKEEHLLRGLSEMAIILLLPEVYSTSPLLRLLTREALACTILKPAINLLCDSDFINVKIIAYIRQQEVLRARKRPFAYAASYDDFLHMIKDCDDLETLKHIRYNIVTEIMFNVQQLKAKEVNEEIDKTTDDTEVRRIRRYINQLTYAKTQSERRLRVLGWRNFPADETGSEADSFDGKQALPLLSVLESVEGRAELESFLQQQSASTPTPEGVGSPASFLAYWVTAEKMRQSPRQLWHQLAQELYYTHIQPPSSPLKVEKGIRKRMESFLLGDQGPEVFYEVQEEVVKILEEKYYPMFVTSDQYQRMLSAMEEAVAAESLDSSEGGHITSDCELGSASLVAVPEQQNYSRRKLVQLEEKLDTKRQALQALRTSLKPESRVLSLLEKEVEKLEGERRQLEAHLTRTENWAEHLGRWRATVQSAELRDEREPPEFVLVVHMMEDENDSDAISTGWVVLRKLTEFSELHRKLSQLDPEVKNLELPTYSSKFLFGKTIDKSALDKAKTLIQRYLEVVLEDERLNQSEALYTFLSPSSDHLKQAPASPKKNKFSLSTLFKSGSAGSSGSMGGSGVTGTGEESEDEELLLGEDGRMEDAAQAKDGIAEPLYVLLGEVFDVRGLFRWLRRSLITFVQITYGRTITRQVRETVAWVFSESMLHYYAQVFIGSWWPHGQLATPAPLRSAQQKLQTRSEARRLFIANVPEILSNLVGQQSARNGALKVFDALQETKLNKQLFYELLEVILYEIFPSELGSS